MPSTKPTPVLLLGGQENTLCLVRCFGRREIPVYVSAPSNCMAIKSRYCNKAFVVPQDTDTEKFWVDLLLKEKNPELEGSVIMSGSDVAVEFVANFKDQLQEKYLVDDHTPELHLNMLDKQKTLELGAEAGCATPFFHNIDTLEDIEKIIDTVMFPIMIKPIHSHLFQQHFQWKKYLVANNRQELYDNVQKMLDLGLESMITEMIPGPDDLQSAYFTYINDQGEEMFQYTHQIIRRYPKNSGSGCLHVTRWLPETAEMGQRFFKGIGFRGMGHIEFKHDLRDGKLKIIECNPRFSAAQAVAMKSGLDMAFIIYCHLTNSPKPADRSYRYGVRRWLTITDLLAFLELRKLGEITFLEWIKSIKGPPLVFPYFSLSDPIPFLHRFSSDLFNILSKRVRLP